MQHSLILIGVVLFSAIEARPSPHVNEDLRKFLNDDYQEGIIYVIGDGGVERHIIVNGEEVPERYIHAQQDSLDVIVEVDLGDLKSGSVGVNEDVRAKNTQLGSLEVIKNVGVSKDGLKANVGAKINQLGNLDTANNVGGLEKVEGLSGNAQRKITQQDGLDIIVKVDLEDLKSGSVGVNEDVRAKNTQLGSLEVIKNVGVSKDGLKANVGAKIKQVGNLDTTNNVGGLENVEGLAGNAQSKGTQLGGLDIAKNGDLENVEGLKGNARSKGNQLGDLDIKNAGDLEYVQRLKGSAGGKVTQLGDKDLKNAADLENVEGLKGNALVKGTQLGDLDIKNAGDLEYVQGLKGSAGAKVTQLGGLDAKNAGGLENAGALKGNGRVKDNRLCSGLVPSITNKVKDGAIVFDNGLGDVAHQVTGEGGFLGDAVSGVIDLKKEVDKGAIYAVNDAACAVADIGDEAGAILNGEVDPKTGVDTIARDAAGGVGYIGEDVGGEVAEGFGDAAHDLAVRS